MENTNLTHGKKAIPGILERLASPASHMAPVMNSSSQIRYIRRIQRSYLLNSTHVLMYGCLVDT